MTACHSWTMEQVSLLFLMLNTLCAFSQIPHEVVYVVGCSDDGSTEVQYEFDHEELLYMNFGEMKIVYTVPDFILLNPGEIVPWVHIKKDALKAKIACEEVFQILSLEGISPPEVADPPETMLYTADEAQLGVENSLTCFVNHFYPPNIKVSWTKNGLPVSEGVSLSRYYPNEDQTFHQFSTLKFTPEVGDNYSCIVEHISLDRPTTRIWDFSTEDEVSHSSVSPDVVCGVGVTLGSMGVAGGLFLMVKGHLGHP